MSRKLKWLQNGGYITRGINAAKTATRAMLIPAIPQTNVSVPDENIYDIMREWPNSTWYVTEGTSPSGTSFRKIKASPSWSEAQDGETYNARGREHVIYVEKNNPGVVVTRDIYPSSNNYKQQDTVYTMSAPFVPTRIYANPASFYADGTSPYGDVVEVAPDGLRDKVKVSIPNSLGEYDPVTKRFIEYPENAFVPNKNDGSGFKRVIRKPAGGKTTIETIVSPGIERSRIIKERGTGMPSDTLYVQKNNKGQIDAQYASPTTRQRSAYRNKPVVPVWFNDLFGNVYNYQNGGVAPYNGYKRGPGIEEAATGKMDRITLLAPYGGKDSTFTYNGPENIIVVNRNYRNGRPNTVLLNASGDNKYAIEQYRNDPNTVFNFIRDRFEGKKKFYLEHPEFNWFKQ